MKTLTKASKVIAKTALKIEKSVQNTVHDVAGPKAVQIYDLIEQVGSAGPGYLWKLYKGRPKSKSAAVNSVNAEVCVWILDKKALADERHKKGTSKAAEERLFEIFRADAAYLLKLRHPGVIRIVEPLDESKYMMAMATEPVFASLSNVLKEFTNVIQPPEELKNLDLSELEIKYGFLQLAEALAFIHNEGRIVHRAISPQTVVISAGGVWKLCGFGFAAGERTAEQTDVVTGFDYHQFDLQQPGLPLQPPLDFVAPELTQSNAGRTPTPATDIFSLALVAYRVFGGACLLNCQGNVKTYQSAVSMLLSRDFYGISAELVYELRRMLSLDPGGRPGAMEFGGTSFFRDDPRIRAIRFLDQMLERDTMQKTEFLKALAGMWSGLDFRILRYKVLPPLAAELRNETTQVLVLPMIMSIGEAQGAKEFEAVILPSLLPVMQTASGDMLLMLLKHTPLISTKIPNELVKAHLLPMLVRAYDDSDSRIQEEVLRRTVAASQKLDYQIIKQSILPRVHGQALKTTSATVRVHALVCLGELAQRMDKPSMLEVLGTCARCVAVDRSAPTLMCVLGIGDVLIKQCGVEFAAESILPLLGPLITSPQLNAVQFGKYVRVIRSILQQVEEKRGFSSGDANASQLQDRMGAVTITNGGANSAKPNPATPAPPSIALAWDVSDWSASSKPTVLALEYTPCSGAATPAPSNMDSGGLKSSAGSSDIFGYGSQALQQSVPIPNQPAAAGTWSGNSGGGGFRDFQWPSPQQSSGSSGAQSLQQNNTSPTNPFNVGINRETPTPSAFDSGLNRPSTTGLAWDSYGHSNVASSSGRIAGSGSGSGDRGGASNVEFGTGLLTDVNDPFRDWPPRSGPSGSELAIFSTNGGSSAASHRTGSSGPFGGSGLGSGLGMGSGNQTWPSNPRAQQTDLVSGIPGSGAGGHQSTFANSSFAIQAQGGRGSPLSGRPGTGPMSNNWPASESTAPRQQNDYGSGDSASRAQIRGPAPPKLLPPPSRGGGMSRFNSMNRSSQPPPANQPPPLLDLL